MFSLANESKQITKKETLHESLQQLELEKTRLSLALTQMPAAIAIADISTKRITNINKRFEYIWKVPFRGTTVQDFGDTYQLFHLDGSPYAMDERPLIRSMKGETIVAEEALFRRGDGSTGFLLVNAAPVRDSEDKIVGGIAVHSDITESKELQRKLEDINKNLEHLVEERTKKLKDSERMAAIGLTASMVGHDIRNPLQAMTSDVYLLKTELSDKPEFEESIKETLESLESSISYINTIISDLQDFAKPLKPDLVEVSNLCTTVKQSLSTVNIPSFIEYEIRCDEDLPKVKLDLNYFKRILVNLVTNAIQAMQNGGKLTITAFRSTGNIVVTIRDTGIGIPEHIKPKLFTPLMTTKPQGQGLGLAVVKRLVEAQNGSIMFESQEGKGTEFIIRLPLTQPVE